MSTVVFCCNGLGASAKDAPFFVLTLMCKLMPLGFARTGPTITATVDSLVRSLIRAQRIESKGGQLRVLRRNESHE